jgi:hypothetical protein
VRKDEVKKDDVSYYCTHHGKNSTHATKDCFTLKNRATKANAGNNTPKRNFSARAFHKEVNHLVKNGNKSKKKVLEAYLLSIKKEQKKLKTIKLKKGRAARVLADTSDESSDLEMSVQVLEMDNRKPAACKKKRVISDDSMEEEKDFQEKIKRLGLSDNDSSSESDLSVD